MKLETAAFESELLTLDKVDIARLFAGETLAIGSLRIVLAAVSGEGIGVDGFTVSVLVDGVPV